MVFGALFSRLFSCTAKAESTSLSGKYKFVHCPKPVKDTGCTYCEIPQFPNSHQIDHERKLRNSTVALYKHVLLLSGFPDHESWPRRFELSPGHVISDLTTLKRKFTDGYHPSLVSMTSLQEESMIPGFDFGHSALLGLYPDGLAVEVPIRRLQEFVTAYLAGEPVDLAEKERQEELRSSFRSLELKKDYILVCGHAKRDIRCGTIGPLVMAEFKKGFEINRIPGESATLGYISHVGGHAFAGNVLVFKKNGDVIWYGRVEPKHVQGIVEKTVLGSEVIEELYRG